MIIEYVIFYAIKKALGLKDENVKYSYSPFCLNAKVNSKYSRCKHIVIYGDKKEVDIFFENSITDGAISEIGKFGTVVVKPITMPDPNELTITPLVEHGICLHMSWR